ncbi:hypothetical protein BH10BAC2_BH10BAC2_15450 [soil metagenome]
MKLYPLIVLLILLSIRLFSQSNQFSVKANIKATIDNSAYIFSFNDKQNDNACMIMNTRDTVNGYIINNSGTILHQFSFQKAERKMLPVAGYFTDDRITVLYAKHYSDEYIYTYSYFISENKIDSSIATTAFGKKPILSIINTGDNVLFICADKKEAAIFLYEMHDGNIKQSGKYSFESFDNMPYKKSAFYQRLNDFAFGYVNEFRQKSTQQLISRNKIYSRNDSLIFILDKKWQSELLIIDRKANACAYKTIDQPCDYCELKKEVLNINSYLLNDNLYYVKICHEGLQLNVTNISTGESVAKYICEADKQLNFKNTNFLRISGLDDKSELDKSVDIIWNQKAFLRKAAANDFLVLAEYDSMQNVLLRIGSVDIITGEEQTRPIMFYTSGYDILAALVADIAISIINPPDWSKTKMVYFETKLQAKTYKHLPGEMPSMTDEKIAAVMSNKKIRPQYRTLLRYNHANYFVYYDPKSDSLVFNRI